MKKMTIVTVAIWLTAVSSAAALVNVLAHPPSPVVEALKIDVPRDPAPEIPVNLDHFKVPRPNIEPARVRTQLSFSRAKKIELRCSGWKSMQLGPVDRSVRYCQ